VRRVEADRPLSGILAPLQAASASRRLLSESAGLPNTTWRTHRVSQRGAARYHLRRPGVPPRSVMTRTYTTGRLQMAGGLLRTCPLEQHPNGNSSGAETVAVGTLRPPATTSAQTASWPSRRLFLASPTRGSPLAARFRSRAEVLPSVPRRGAWRSLPWPEPAPVSGVRRGARAWNAATWDAPGVALTTSPRGPRARGEAPGGRSRFPEARPSPLRGSGPGCPLDVPAEGFRSSGSLPTTPFPEGGFDMRVDRFGC
jgi:hypothetical protein